ncbi:MAG: response regulator transcription factor [Bifidobacteriaceae bacterium]|jgi:DNA-binding response OmpR family regulator|nr:response regulator transcription factor [Bifidobacteriaceae bacterium]
MRILIVEDEPALAEQLVLGLTAQGYQAEAVHNGTAAVAQAARAGYDIVLLDRDLPGMHGDDVCRLLTGQGYPARILMLTAADTLADKVTGLDLGADDYLAKPFAYAELLARLRALGRRRPGTGEPSLLTCGDLSLDPERRLAQRAGRPLPLTAKELDVLECLLEADGGHVGTAGLLAAVWGNEAEPGVVKLAIHTLRRKLGPPDLIHTSPGLGYRLAVDHG